MWLVIVLLAVALSGFIIMDMTNANNMGSFGSRTTIAEVAGQKIDYLDFQRMESALYSGSGDVYGSRNSLWNYMIENAILEEIAEDAGIGVGGEELTELEFGTNLSPIVQSYYRNPQTGVVDREQLNQIKKAIDEGTVSNPEFATRFNELRKQVIKSQKQTKLNALVAKALYAPTWYAETMDKLNNESATFEYVRIAYDSIPDTEIKLTDADFEAYIKENEKRFTNKEEVRNLEYVVFDVKATAEDSLVVKSNMDSLARDFAVTTNDSLFAASNNGLYGMNYQKKDDFPGSLKDNVASMTKGSIYGPYIDNGAYLVAKLIDKKVIADSAKASHILRSVANGDPVQLAAANKYIDSLKNAIQSGATTFADAATNNSQDPGSAQSGGELGTFAPGAMVQPFNDAVFNGKEGGLYTVTTQFGVHLIKVEKLIYETNEMKYNVAFIAQPIVASEATQNALETRVMELLEGTKTLEDLAKAATGDIKVETAGGIKKNDYMLGALGSEQTSRDIIRWAFEDAEEGKVSPTLYTYSDKDNYVDSKHVIIGLKSVDKPGLASVASVKATIEAKVKNAKKASLIKSKIQGNDLNAIAVTFSETVKNAENVYYGGAFIPDAGQEPLLIGELFGANAGTAVGPVDGNAGVYVAKLITKSPANGEAGAFGTKLQLTQGARMQVNFRLMDSLKKQYEVEDNRFTFY